MKVDNVCDKFRLVAYATVKRIQGYHLLKNPQATPSTELNMIKYDYFVKKNLDVVRSYKRIKKDFANSSTEKKYLCVIQPNKKDKLAKSYDYLELTGKKSSICSKSSEIDNLSVENIPLKDYLNRVTETNLKEKDRYFSNGNALSDIYLYGKVLEKPEPPNFFKLLFQNISKNNNVK